MKHHESRQTKLDLAEFVREVFEELDELQEPEVRRLVELAVSRRTNNSEKITEMIYELHRE